MESNIYADPGISIEKELHVNTFDIDAAGHVNNVVYLRWAEELRVEFLMKYFRFREIVESGMYFVVVKSTLVHRRQIKLFETPHAIIAAKSIQKGIILLGIEIETSGKTAAQIEQKCVVFDLKLEKMISGNGFDNLFRTNF